MAFSIRMGALVAAAIVSGCGGGASGCGMEPLPAGFPADARVDNAASMRMTDSGFQFLNENLGTFVGAAIGGSGVVMQPIPEYSGTSGDLEYHICPGGPDLSATPPKCAVELDFASLQLALTPNAPHHVDVSGTLPVRIQDLPVDVKYLLVPDSTIVVLNGQPGTCPPDFQPYALLPFSFRISVDVDTDATHARAGASRMKIEDIQVDTNAIEQQMSYCGGTLTAATLNVLQPILVAYLHSQIGQGFDSQVEDQTLCEQANPMVDPTCPVGSTDVDGTCRYGTTDADPCMPALMGTEGHMAFAAGGLDVTVAVGGPGKRDDDPNAAWGDLDPIAGGATLGIFGGAKPAPASACVAKPAALPFPTDIPIPDALRENTRPDWPTALPGPHFAVALSQRWLNFTMGEAYDGGAFCAALTTETTPLLNSGSIGLLAGSLKNLALQREAASVAIVSRLAHPPTIVFGDGTDLDKDPTMRMRVEKASFDFYIWSEDRYIRFMTATFDVELPLNLVVSKEGLAPVGDKVLVTNATVTNSELLSENPEQIASALQSLIAGAAGQLFGSFAPVQLGGAGPLGLQLTIPESVPGQGSPGIRHLVQGSDDFLGVFASIQQVPPPPPPPFEAAVVRREVDPAGVRLATMTPANAPSVVVGWAADDADAEISYRVDDGVWHPFTSAPELVVRDGWLRWQGHHVVELRARHAGAPVDLSAEPTRLDVTIDVDPPSIDLVPAADGTVSVAYFDEIASNDELVARVALDGIWSDWRPASELSTIDPGDAASITVEARDPEGNLGTASSALIRGAPGAAAGCGCDVPGPATGAPIAWYAALALLALRRKRRN